MKLQCIGRFLALGHDERIALFKATVALAGSTLALKALGLKRTIKLLARAPHRTVTELDASGIIAEETLAIARAARASGLGTCLTRALALYLRLQRRGVITRLRIGVNRTGNALAAHAWLEHDGHATDDISAGISSYVAFPPIEIERGI